eukprot:365157-Chlamydomonas_euryale.AAC.42
MALPPEAPPDADACDDVAAGGASPRSCAAGVASKRHACDRREGGKGGGKAAPTVSHARHRGGTHATTLQRMSVGARFWGAHTMSSQPHGRPRVLPAHCFRRLSYQQRGFGLGQWPDRKRPITNAFWQEPREPLFVPHSMTRRQPDAHTLISAIWIRS